MNHLDSMQCMRSWGNRAPMPEFFECSIHILIINEKTRRFFIRRNLNDMNPLFFVQREFLGAAFAERRHK